MDFRILGPLEVVAEGHTVDLAAAKPRALLAILLLHANEPVASAWLVEELWNGNPPATAQKTLQVYILRLRRLLGEERIVTTPSGYQLRVEDDELDLDRFEKLCAAGQHADALSLWRGRPLADFAHEAWAQTEIARLEELNLTVLGERIDTDLAQGSHAELVAELEALVAKHPLRERLSAQLMLALYRSGRQAAALKVYQDLRGKLDTELGLSPSRELQDLQRSILAQEETLDPPTQLPLPAKRGRLGWILVAVTGLVATGVASAMGVTQTGSATSVLPLKKDSVIRIDAVRNRIVAAIPVGAEPDLVRFGAGTLWVRSFANSTVSQIDPNTNRVIATLRPRPVGRVDLIAAAPGPSVWIGSYGARIATYAGTIPGRNLWHYDARTKVLSRVPTPPLTPLELQADVSLDDDGSVWVLEGQALLRLLRISASGRILTSIPLPAHQGVDTPPDIRVDNGALWYSEYSDPPKITIYRVGSQSTFVAETLPKTVTDAAL